MPIRRDLRHHYATAEWRAAREAVLARAANRCESCGARGGVVAEQPCRHCAGAGRVFGDCAGAMKCPPCQGRGGRKSRIQLGVAHLNHDPSDHSLDNLKALCRACHLRHDQPHHLHTRTRSADFRRGQMRFDQEPRP